MKVHIHETNYVGTNVAEKFVHDIRWDITKNGKDIGSLYWDSEMWDGTRLLGAAQATLETLELLGIKVSFTDENRKPI